MLITPKFTMLSTEDFTAPQPKWSAFLPATLLHPPLIIIRAILVIASLADSRNVGLEVAHRGTCPRRGYEGRQATFSESARPRMGVSWQGKRWPAASAREDGPCCRLEATEVIEFLLLISFCGRMSILVALNYFEISCRGASLREARREQARITAPRLQGHRP